MNRACKFVVKYRNALLAMVSALVTSTSIIVVLNGRRQ